MQATDSSSRECGPGRPVTPEARLFVLGVALSLLWPAALAVCVRLAAASPGDLIGMVTAHLISGRAGGISVGLDADLPRWLVIANAAIVDSVVVLLVYPLFVFSQRNLVRSHLLQGVLQRSIASAQRGRARITRFGILGLLLFVWVPLHMTGPLAGSIVGYFLRLHPYVNILVVLTGTFLAVLSWVFLFGQLMSSLGGYSYLVPIGVVSAALVGFLILRAKQRRASRPEAAAAHETKGGVS